MGKEGSFEQALDYLSQDQRLLILDSLFCEFHNSWQTMAGNTEENDVEWFAIRLFVMKTDKYDRLFDRLSVEEQEEYRLWAAMCLRSLPLLVSRIANRWKVIRDVLDVSIKADRKAFDEIRETLKKRP